MTVLNKYKLLPGQTGVYIGRGSIWGNPFVIGRDGDRNAVCDKHTDHLWKQIRDGEITLQQLADLDGKNLICFCAPCRCHGDTLVKAAAWAKAQLKLTNHKDGTKL
jgi:hypothetical protein